MKTLAFPDIDRILFPQSRREQLRFLRSRLDRRFIVGEVLGGTGTTPPTGRQGVLGDTIVSQGSGKYSEYALRGRLAFACDQAGGVSTNAALSTTAILSLYNPVNSGVLLIPLLVGVAYFSGTLGAGPLYHCATPQVSGTAQTQPSGGTALTSYWSGINIPGKTASPAGLVRTGPTVVAPIAAFAFASISTGAGFNAIKDDLDSWIYLWPGASYQLQDKCAAGTSPKVTPSIVWAEVPILT